MAKDNVLELEGIVINASNSRFEVQVSEKFTVDCVLSGKIRMNNVRVLVGDKVKIEVSAYDVKRGRITYRIKQ